MKTKQTFSVINFTLVVKNSMKITRILLNTSLYTTELIMVPSVKIEFCSRVVSLPKWIVYFLKFLGRGN